MKSWKWTALVFSGGLLLQAGVCLTDFFYLLMQGFATQLASGLVTQAVQTTTGAAG